MCNEIPYRCVSVDGDADRVVYFFQKSGVFHLLDGDKIATLIAGYIGELVNQSGLQDKIKLVFFTISMPKFISSLCFLLM